MATNAKRYKKTVKDTASVLASANSIYPAGWDIIESDTDKRKVADGVTSYNFLPYVGDIASITNLQTTLNNKADLVANLIPENQLPEVDITPIFVARQFEEGSGNNVGKLQVKPYQLMADQIINFGLMAWIPQVGITQSPLGFGIAPPNPTGTVVSRAFDTATFLGMEKRVGLQGASTAGTRISWRLTIAQFCRKAGFAGHWKWSNPDGIAGDRFFAGLLADTTMPANSEPTTWLNTIGIVKKGPDSVYYIIRNDGAGTVAQETDITPQGAFPFASTDIYELILLCPAAGNVTYIFSRYSSSTGALVASATGTVTAKLPATTTALSTQIWRSNNTNAVAFEMDLMSCTFATRNYPIV